jgi:hypothetical protein
MMRNTPPPLASNDLFGIATDVMPPGKEPINESNDSIRQDKGTRQD